MWRGARGAGGLGYTDCASAALHLGLGWLVGRDGCDGSFAWRYGHGRGERYTRQVPGQSSIQAFTCA